MTPAMFAALRKRRLVEFRYARYLQGIVASETHNVAIAQAGSDKWRDPLDYVGIGAEEDKFAELRANILAFFQMSCKGKEALDRPELIKRLSSSGRYTEEEISNLLNEMFPE